MIFGEPLSFYYSYIAFSMAVITWVLYWTVCKTDFLKQGLLFCASGAIVAVISLKLVSLVVVVISAVGLVAGAGVVYYWANLLRKNPSLLSLIIAVIITLAAMVYIKLLQPVMAEFSDFTRIAVPIGISYYTFKMVHYLIESSRGQFKENSFLTFLTYLYFFPMFLSGPIERYNNFYPQSQNIAFRREDMAMGVERIMIGLIQKLIISDMIISSFLIPSVYMEPGAAELSWHIILFASFAKFLSLYFDFAGYTSMAIGIGHLFGYKLMENFNFPLLRPTLAEFWRNWHISLSGWARDYVYFPILMKYRMPNLALVCTMLTIGAWHSILPGWIMWGLHHGFGLVLLSMYQRNIVKFEAFNNFRSTVAWRYISVPIVWWYVSLGYSLTMRAESFEHALSNYFSILTFGLVS